MPFVMVVDAVAFVFGANKLEQPLLVIAVKGSIPVVPNIKITRITIDIINKDSGYAESRKQKNGQRKNANLDELVILWK